MTLIVFVATAEYVVLASDRRLTTFVGSKIVNQEDKALKTFLLNGQLLMGFTGLAAIDGVPMEDWVCEQLNGVLPKDVPERLKTAMDDYYRRTPRVRKYGHHFRLVGFAFNPKRVPSRFPIGIEVGNCTWINRGGTVVQSDIRPEFSVVHNRFGNHGQVVGAVGSAYSHQALRELERHVRIARRAAPTKPNLVFNPLVEFMRNVARNSGGTVGETVLISSLPKMSTPMRSIGWSVPLSVEGIERAAAEPMAMVVLADDAPPVFYLPASIYPEVQTKLMTIEFGPRSPDGA